MPIQDYDIRLYGRRRCKNCFWYEDCICFFHSSEETTYRVKETSWCPDWYSRRIANKEGEFLHNTDRYKIVDKTK